MLNLNLRPLQPGSQQGPDSGRTVSMSCQHPHINTRMRERKFKVTARLAPTDTLRAFDGRARPSPSTTPAAGQTRTGQDRQLPVSENPHVSDSARNYFPRDRINSNLEAGLNFS